MIPIVTSKYRLELNERCGCLENLRYASDPAGVNLVNKDDVSACGSVAYTRKGKPWKLVDNGSPVGVKSWGTTEYHAFANLVSRTEKTAVFRNTTLGFTLGYEFFEEGFDMTLSGAMPEADMIALDLSPVFVDLRQNDPREFQFTLHSFYTSTDRSLVYVYCERLDGKGGILFHSRTHCSGWRIRYQHDRSSGAGSLQMVRRFPAEFDPLAEEAPKKMTVRVSFHRSCAAALNALAEWENIPLLSAPVMSAETGASLPFHVRGKYARLFLTRPDGSTEDLTVHRINLRKEGFYRVTAVGKNGRSSELLCQCRAPVHALLERCRRHLKPLFCDTNSEHFGSWVQSLLYARRVLGDYPRLNPYLYDALIRFGRNGVPVAGFEWKEIPSAEETAAHLRPRHAVMRNCHMEYDGFAWRGTPAPAAFEYNGVTLPACHIYRSERIQDAFAFVTLYLEAAESCRCEGFYEYAVAIAMAHLESHLEEDGALRRRENDLKIDYTTVIAPAESLAELYLAMKQRRDKRADVIHDACCRIADYLVRRGMNFPTEGEKIHYRWTEDGSISCTALSLLWVYRAVEAKPEYLAMARKVLAFHRAWQIETPDVRTNRATWRYWENKWENDGEGAAVNAGHVWNLWRGEALFHLGVVDRDPVALLDSWNTFGCNLSKIDKKGRNYSSFVSDAMPQQPRRKKLYACLPEHEDRTISYYCWTRLAQTWNRLAAVVDTPEGDTVMLNGRLEKNSGGWLAVSSAPEGGEVLMLSRRTDIRQA